MIAASIILTRALAPVEQVVGHWRSFVAARLSMKQLRDILPRLAVQERQSELPAPRSVLSVQNLVVAAPGTTAPVLENINIKLQAGDGVGIIGPSGAGKTTMARALLGTWPAVRGEIRLDGAMIDQYTTKTLGSAVGYLPQDVELFDGTVFENIARFNEDATTQDVISAARIAGCHDMILELCDGYDTTIGPSGQGLSGGQRQRIGLARALFGKPFLVVLDEPNSNLDQTGEIALTNAISHLREQGCIVVIVAHRRSALASVNKVLALKNGRQAAFGPREQVLHQLFGRHSGTPAKTLKVVNE
jgi:PrtD family type I secretion system ABC transporter